MKKKRNAWIAFGVLAALGIAWFLTDYPIQYDERPYRAVTLVGGALSHADVAYRDYRPVVAGETHIVDVLYGTKAGEWRRYEIYSTDSRRPYSETIAVLRDKTNPWSFSSVARSNRRAVSEYQNWYNGLIADYEAQSIWDRVPIWRLMANAK